MAVGTRGRKSHRGFKGRKPSLIQGNTRFAHLTLKVRHQAAGLRKKLPEWLTAYVSPLGWSVTGIAVVCLSAFPALGWHELLVCGIVGLVMLALGIAMSLGNTKFHAALSVSDNRITVGDSVKVDVNVSNPGKSPTVGVQGDLPMGEMHQRFRIPALAPGKVKDEQVEFRATSRAVLDVGPLKISKGDPFGIVRHEQSLSQSAKVYIHPKTVFLNTLDSGIFRDLEGSPSGQVVDDDLDFYGLREYRPGDDMRNVHWLSSAKTGTLMVRQYEATKRTDTSITLGVNPTDYSTEDEFELAVSVASSIGTECLVEDRPLAVQAADNSLIPHGAMPFLDWMSGVKPDMDENPNLAVATLKTSPGASFYFFVVGSGARLERLRRIAAALSRESICVMLQIDPIAGNAIHQYDDFTLATLSALDDLPLIMEALK
ncbi:MULTISPECIES: DUF58 domain-containing protein [unclassified Bifidobacterium]|uniref:DUF58 domain-containing protein n=1 Tax=unclassified Bifidobacterium TaxID=2608897 RepID=UPI0023F64C06|nr:MULTISPECIES: DUF58 domain-containing protein [unclassified Bifidobacterium]WEV65521.1 DUF58 domain-containing protein [Bifidobacterium sp. ESL0764]WEV75673.1 DUF58 domain-containing protein [Bifidobacterium sp. ESL0800]